MALITVTASLSIDIEGLEEDLQRLEELKRKAEEKLEELKEKAKKAMEADKGLEQDILDLQKKYEEAKQLIEKKIEKIKKEIKKVQTQASLSVNNVKRTLGDALAEFGNRIINKANNPVKIPTIAEFNQNIKTNITNTINKMKTNFENFKQRITPNNGVGTIGTLFGKVTENPGNYVMSSITKWSDNTKMKISTFFANIFGGNKNSTPGFVDSPLSQIANQPIADNGPIGAIADEGPGGENPDSILHPIDIPDSINSFPGGVIDSINQQETPCLVHDSSLYMCRQKPILYLYPTGDNTDITVTFEKPELLLTTYPKYRDSWNVTANKNGDLYDNDGKYYYGLYWDEKDDLLNNFSKGFYVTKDNAIDFLEDKLTKIGLSDRERNEFIMYWLPKLENNGKSIVNFEFTEERDAHNKLNINPKPDSILRLLMNIKKVDAPVDIPEQELKTFNRTGFAAVEWGGTEQ